MKDTLIIGQRMGETGRYRIQWAFPDGELGGYLGQDKNDGSEDPPEDRDAWDHWAASKAVMGLPGSDRDDTSTFWETEAGARVALRLAKAALKQVKPLPDWAKTALAEGWKPPKGWKA